VRSRLKRMMVGWWMALGRMACFYKEIYNRSVAEAEKLCKELIGSEHPVFEPSTEHGK